MERVIDQPNRETALMAASFPLSGIAYLHCRPTSAAWPVKAVVRKAALLGMLPIARAAIIWFFCFTLMSCSD